MGFEEFKKTLLYRYAVDKAILFYQFSDDFEHKEDEEVKRQKTDDYE